MADAQTVPEPLQEPLPEWTQAVGVRHVRCRWVKMLAWWVAPACFSALLLAANVSGLTDAMPRPALEAATGGISALAAAAFPPNAAPAPGIQTRAEAYAVLQVEGSGPLVPSSRPVARNDHWRQAPEDFPLPQASIYSPSVPWENGEGPRPPNYEGLDHGTSAPTASSVPASWEKPVSLIEVVERHVEASETYVISLSPLERMMMEAINRERVQLDLDPLELDTTLIELARTRSHDMADKNYFSHTSPGGATARSLMISAGIGPGVMGEILGRNNSPDYGRSIKSVAEAFMASPGHRRTILNPIFVSAGIGAAIGLENMKYYTVLFFGP